MVNIICLYLEVGYTRSLLTLKWFNDEFGITSVKVKVVHTTQFELIGNLSKEYNATRDADFEGKFLQSAHYLLTRLN